MGPLLRIPQAVISVRRDWVLLEGRLEKYQFFMLMDVGSIQLVPGGRRIHGSLLIQSQRNRETLARCTQQSYLIP